MSSWRLTLLVTLLLLMLPSWRSGAATAAAELLIESDPVVRSGVLFRCTVTGDVAPAAHFLSVALIEGGLVLAAREVELSSATDTVRGVTVVLAPSQAARTPSVQVRVSDSEHRPLWLQLVPVSGTLAAASFTSPLSSPLTSPLSRPKSADSMTRLLAEQLAELRHIATPTRAQHLLFTELQCRLAGGAPAAGPLLMAVPDDVDGSVHPARLHGVVDGAVAQSVVILLRPLPGQTKSAWSGVPAAWLAAAAQAGVAVLEVYPAGDLTLTGVARRRAAQAETAARQVAPGLGAAWPILAHPGLVEAAAWRHATPLPTVPTLAGGLVAWASGSFVVVIGTGEHATAIADNQALAESFVRAWAAHAHGVPPVVTDVAFEASQWEGYHLVLIGSSRSNAVLRQRCRTLPISWDDRTLRVGDRLCQRAYRPALACALADPQANQQTLLVLDGAPAWGAPLGALPLQAEAEVADLVLRPGQPSEGPVVRLLLAPQASGP